MSIFLSDLARHIPLRSTTGVCILAAAGLIALCLYRAKNDKLMRRLFYAVLFVFGAAITLQMSQTFLNFDDFGYTALSYQNQVFDVEGLNYSLPDVFRFLLAHYQNWGGRILYFFFEIILLKGSVWWFRLVEAAILISMMAVMSRIVGRKSPSERLLSLLCLILCYALLEIEILREGVYWYTAAVLYVFPVLPVCCLVTGYYKKSQEPLPNCSVMKTIGWGALAFLSAFSQEQISFALLAVLCFILIEKRCAKRRWNRLDAAVFGSALLGFLLLLLLCPGNSLRAQPTQSPLLERMIGNGKTIEYIFFGSENIRLFMALILITVGLIAIQAFCRDKKRGWPSRLLALFFWTLAGSFLLKRSPIYLLMTLTGSSTVMHIMLLFFTTIPACGYILWYGVRKNRVFELLLAAVGALSLLPALVAPGVSMRMMVPFCLFAFPLVARVFIDSLCFFRSFWKALTALLLCALIGLGAYNFFTILRGYAVNLPVQLENDRRLTEAAQTGKHEVLLYRLPEDQFAYIQPYQEGLCLYRNNTPLRILCIAAGHRVCMAIIRLDRACRKITIQTMRQRRP